MVDQRDAGARLVGARPLDHHLRAVGLAEGGGEGVVVLGQFAFLAAVLELDFAIGQLDQRLAGLDDVDGRVDQGACFGVGDRQVRGGALTTPAADMPDNVQGA